MGDRIVILRDGVIQQIGTPQDVYDSPANVYVAGFIGTPSMNLLQGTIVRRNGLMLDAGGYGIPLTHVRGADLDKWVDRPVIAGIRPSAIALGAPPSEDGNGVVSGKVDVVEPMGDMAFIVADVGGQSLTVRIDPSSIPAVGEEVPLWIDGAALHIFDADTQKAIVNASPQAAHTGPMSASRQ